MGVLLLVMAVSLNAKAQTYTGCVIYEDNGAPRLWSPMYLTKANYTSLCNNYIVESYNIMGATVSLNNCRYTPVLPKATPARFRNCKVFSSCGIIRTITITPCPLDDYAGYLLLSWSAIAVLFIRKID